VSERPPDLDAGPPLDDTDLLSALGETLANLSVHRPLDEVLLDIVRQAARVLRAAHGYLALGTGHERPLRAAVGAWVDVGPLELEETIRSQGSALAGAVTLAVPVRVGGRVAGVLALGRDAGGGGAFGEQAPALLERFAQIAALAHENDRLFATERFAREQAQALRAATQALSATLTLQEVLASILSELANVVPYDTASVQELQGDRMVIIGGRGIDLDHFLGVGFEAVQGQVPNRDVLQTRAPVIVPDILGRHVYADFPSVPHALSGVRSWLGVPLLFGNACIGMLTLDKVEPGFYTTAHAQTALVFGAQAAIAIKNARLYEGSLRELAERRRAEEELRDANERLKGQLAEIEALQARLRDQAIRDPLTGLFNRRYLTETLQRELSRCLRESRPLALVLLDVDHFKALNDAYGHETGDRMLQAVGGFLGEQTRHGDVACRYGGEEFVVVLPGASAQAAAARAQAWRAEFERLRIVHQGHDVGVTLSMGVAECPTHAATADSLLRAADVAMYDAKRQGRNRVVLAGRGES
jgi:diguanylate cyclase (GGDEF)-like protein